MDKRYQVFVSSTYEDLTEARQEVMQALLELDCIPAGMELFPAADDDQWTLIKGVIDDCDYYIVIIGGRYGSLGPDGKSYTQMEYEYAVTQEKPVIAFLHKNPNKLPADCTEKDADKSEKLENFRELTQKKMVKYWTEPVDLGSVVSRSLVKLIRSNPAIGWVRADLLPSKDTTEEILSLRKKIEAYESEIEQIRTDSPKGTEDLAQGNDAVEIEYSFQATESTDWRGVGYTATIVSTWNKIFANVSPLLIDEANDQALINALNGLIQKTAYSQIKKHEQFKNQRLFGFSINDDEFSTIKVQLLALKLIQKSIRNRSVKDTANYWTLTPYGDSVMMQLRAIKKPGLEEEDDESLGEVGLTSE